jgi:hypothetical protein
LRRDLSVLTHSIGERNVKRHPKKLNEARDWLQGQLVAMGYHSPNDTAENVDADKLARVVVGLRAVIKELVGEGANGELP